MLTFINFVIVERRRGLSRPGALIHDSPGPFSRFPSACSSNRKFQMSFSLRKDFPFSLSFSGAAIILKKILFCRYPRIIALIKSGARGYARSTNRVRPGVLPPRRAPLCPASRPASRCFYLISLSRVLPSAIESTRPEPKLRAHQSCRRFSAEEPFTDSGVGPRGSRKGFFLR